MLERAFDGRGDVPELQAFLATMRHQGAPAGTFQLGDLMYEMYHVHEDYAWKREAWDHALRGDG